MLHRADAVLVGVLVVGVGWGGTAVAAVRPRPSVVQAERAAQPVSPLAGAWWTHLAPAEKERWLEGFLAGAALDSAVAAPEHRFRFAPSVYAAQLDDYYWWSTHATTPVVTALATINQELSTH